MSGHFLIVEAHFYGEIADAQLAGAKSALSAARARWEATHQCTILCPICQLLAALQPDLIEASMGASQCHPLLANLLRRSLHLKILCLRRSRPQ